MLRASGPKCNNLIKYYIFGKEIDYHFQIYLKMNYFPSIAVNEIKNFVLLVLFQFVKCDLPCCCAMNRDKSALHSYDKYTKNIRYLKTCRRIVYMKYIGNIYYRYILCYFSLIRVSVSSHQEHKITRNHIIL